MTMFKTVSKLALTTLFFGTLATTVASAATSPILSKRQTTTTASGKTRSSDCRVFSDRVTIDRFVDGVTTSEEKTFKLGGNFESKIDEVIATKPQTKTVGPLEFSYDMVAYRSTSAGASEEIILSSFDGVKGIDIFNPSSAAVVLKDVMNSVCGSN